MADLQDPLLYALMGLSQVAVTGRKAGISDRDVNVFTVQAAFSTITNVDFDPDRFAALISQAAKKRLILQMDVWSKGPNLFGIKGIDPKMG